MQLEQILLGSQRTGRRLNPESQVTPAQMVFIFLLQNTTEVKKNQNGNETYIEFPWGDTIANINVRFSVEMFFVTKSYRFFKTEKEDFLTILGLSLLSLTGLPL